jgi:hypothetical protein
MTRRRHVVGEIDANQGACAVVAIPDSQMASVTRDEILRLLGPLDDGTVVEVLSADPTLTDLEIVSLRLGQEDDVLGDLRIVLTGAAARVFDIVQRATSYPDEDESGRRVPAPAKTV